MYTNPPLVWFLVCHFCPWSMRFLRSTTNHMCVTALVSAFAKLRLLSPLYTLTFHFWLHTRQITISTSRSRWSILRYPILQLRGPRAELRSITIFFGAPKRIWQGPKSLIEDSRYLSGSLSPWDAYIPFVYFVFISQALGGDAKIGSVTSGSSLVSCACQLWLRVSLLISCRIRSCHRCATLVMDDYKKWSRATAYILL